MRGDEMCAVGGVAAAAVHVHRTGIDRVAGGRVGLGASVAEEPRGAGGEGERRGRGRAGQKERPTRPRLGGASRASRLLCLLAARHVSARILPSMATRVRFAPSPTGFLHIGGVRTALMNWLYAQQTGGAFLVRIENTDTSREVEAAAERIFDDLRWLGLDWDEEPRFQLDRVDAHREAAERLVAEDKAYVDEGAIRLRMPGEGETQWTDLVKGTLRFANADVKQALRPRDDPSAPGDMVIVRADGRPTYNFASPHDDVLDGITHVIRGDDHVSNTPKQLAVMRALGAEPPQYAHLPMVFDDSGKKLSKRRGAASLQELEARRNEPLVYLEEFRAVGYLQDALINHLVLLGWSPGAEETILPLDEILARFRLEDVNPSPARFDYKRLDWMNGVYLRALAPEEFADRLVAYLRQEGYEWDEARVRETAPLVQEKIARLGEYPAFAGFFFQSAEDVPAAAAELDGSVIAAAIEALEPLDEFSPEAIEGALRPLPERLRLKPRDVFRPLYTAVCGRPTGPSLFHSLPLLGKEESLARLTRAGEHAATASADVRVQE